MCNDGQERPSQSRSHAINDEYTDLRRTIGPNSPHNPATDGPFTANRLYEPPRFHMSVLPEPVQDRQKPERRAKATELFLDLIYVLPLSNLADMMTGENSADPHQLLLFTLYYLAVANAWLGEAFFNSRFNADDAIARFLTVCHVGAVVLMSYGITNNSTRHFGTGYVTVRLILIAQYLRALLANFASQILKRVCVGLITGFSISCILWAIGCLWDDNSTSQMGFFYAGIGIDICTPFVLLTLQWLRVSVHPTHMPERLTCFTIVVISVMLCEIVDPNLNVDGIFTELCLFHAAAIPFCLMTLYTQGIPESLPGFSSSICQRLLIYAWIYMHIPLTGCLIYTTTALKNLSACGHQPDATDLTAPHAVAGVASILVILGVQHCMIPGGIVPRGVSRVLVGLLLVLLLVPENNMSDQWYAIVIGLVVIVQLLLEYIIGMLHLQATSSEQPPFTPTQASTRTTPSQSSIQGHAYVSWPQIRQMKQNAAATRHLSALGGTSTSRDLGLEEARSRVDELEEAMYFTRELYATQLTKMQDRIQQLEQELESAYIPLEQT